MTLQDTFNERVIPAAKRAFGTLTVTIHKAGCESPTEAETVSGIIRGAEEFTDANQESIVLTTEVHLPRSIFTDNDIANPRLIQSVDAYGLTGWVANMARTEWSAGHVRLFLERETLLREWQARRATV